MFTSVEQQWNKLNNRLELVYKFLNLSNMLCTLQYVYIYISFYLFLYYVHSLLFVFFVYDMYIVVDSLS